MWRRWLVLSLVLGDTVTSQPITEGENGRETRHLEFRECCPCPGSARAGTPLEDLVPLADQAEVGSDSWSGAVDDCPCRFRDADSNGSPSMLLPRVLRPVRPVLMSGNSKEEPKPLLHPEVDLASSVLETLREATDEEYEDALARDAARSAVRTSDADPDTDKIVTIIIDPNNSNDKENDATAEATHVQESRCIYPFGRSYDEQVEDDQPLHREIFTEPSLLHKKIFDMDNGASNVQERITESMNKGLHRLKLKTNPQALKKLSGDVKSAENFKNIFKGRGLLHSNKPHNFDLTSAKIPIFRLNPVFDNLNKPLNNLRPLNLGINTFKKRARESKDENTNDTDNYLSSSIIFDKKNAENSINDRFRLGFKPILPVGSLKLPGSVPLSLKNLLNLKDVELIPPKSNKLKINIPQLKLPNLHDGIEQTRKSNNLHKTPIFKNKELKDVYDSEVKATELETNIQPIPRENPVETKILDALPSPSENHLVNTYDENFEFSTIPFDEKMISNECDTRFPKFIETTTLTDFKPSEVENIIPVDPTEGENTESNDITFEADEMELPVGSTEYNDAEINTGEAVEIQFNDRDMETDTSNIEFVTDDGNFVAHNNGENEIEPEVESIVNENNLLRQDCLSNVDNDLDSVPETSKNLVLIAQDRDSKNGEHFLDNQEETQHESNEVTSGPDNRALPILRENILLKFRTLSKPNTKLLTLSRYTKPDTMFERANEENQNPSLALETSDFDFSKEDSTETVPANEINSDSEDIDESVTENVNTNNIQSASGQDDVHNTLECKTTLDDVNFNGDIETEPNQSISNENNESTEPSQTITSKVLSTSHTEVLNSIMSPAMQTEILDSIPKVSSSTQNEIISNENNFKLNDNNIPENEKNTCLANLEPSSTTMATTSDDNNIETSDMSSKPSEPVANIAILDSIANPITSSEEISQSDELFSNGHDDEHSNIVPENEDNTCPANVGSSSSTNADISTGNSAEITEMSAKASETFGNIAQGPIGSQFRASPFENIIVQPSSSLSNIFNRQLRPLNLNAPLPTLDDLRIRLTGLLGANQKNDDHQFDVSTEFDSSWDSPNPDVSDRTMATDSSTTSTKSLFPPLKPLKDINLDIFQIKPLAQTGPFISKIPSLNLNAYKAKLAVPESLKLKPIKLQSTLGNNGGLLGAALTLGPSKNQPLFKSSSLFDKKGSDLLGSALTNIPTIHELGDQMRANAESLLSSSITTPRINLLGDGLHSGQSIGDLTNNIRSHTENTMRNLQRTLSSTINQATAKNAEKLAKPSLDLAEMVTSARDDMNDKLKAIHLDLNDRLTSLHESIVDQSNLPTFRSLNMPNNLKINQPSIKTFQMPTTLRKAQTKVISTKKKSPKRPISQLKKPSSQNTMPKSPTRPKSVDGNSFKPFKISKAASSLTPKTVEVPKLTSTSAKPPFSWPLYRDASVKLKETKPTSTVSKPLFGEPTKRFPTKQYKPFGEFKVSFSTTPRPSVSSARKPMIQSGFKPLKTTPISASTKPLVFGERLKSTGDSKGFASEVKPTKIRVPAKLKHPLNTDNNNQDTFKTNAPNSRTTPTKSDVFKFGDTTESSLFKPIIPILQAPQLTLPKIPENSFLTKIREALKSRQLNNNTSQVQRLGQIKSSDMARSASENTEVVLTQEPLKENVSYKCKMVCVREPQY